MEAEDQLPEALQAISGEIPDYLFYLLFHASRQREIAFDTAFADTGVNMNRLRTLAVIRRLEGCTMKDLARLTAIDRTTLTRSVDQLVEQGLVERSTPAGDRRKVQMRLSPAGEAFHAEAAKVVSDFNRRALEGVSRRDQVRMMEILGRVIHRLAVDRETAQELITFGGSGRHRDPA